MFYYKFDEEDMVKDNCNIEKMVAQGLLKKDKINKYECVTVAVNNVVDSSVIGQEKSKKTEEEVQGKDWILKHPVEDVSNKIFFLNDFKF